MTGDDAGDPASPLLRTVPAGYNQGGVPTMRRYDLGSRYETPSREASTHLYPEAPITAAPATPAAPAAAVYGTAAYANPVYTTASHATPVYPSAAYTNPSYRTVVRASVCSQLLSLPPTLIFLSRMSPSNVR